MEEKWYQRWARIAWAFIVAHKLVIVDMAAAVLSWIFGVSTIGFYPWVPAIPPLWLVSRVLYFRGKLGNHLAPSPKPPNA